MNNELSNRAIGVVEQLISEGQYETLPLHIRRQYEAQTGRKIPPTIVVTPPAPLVPEIPRGSNKMSAERISGAPFIPAWLDDLGLSKSAFRVVCHLWRRRGNDGRCNPSAGSIAKVCRITDQTIWSALTELEAKGLLSRRAGYRNSNHYTLIAPSSVTTKEGATETVSYHERGGATYPETGGVRIPRNRGCKGTPIKVPQGRSETPSAPESLPFDSLTFKDAWADFTQHRKEIRKKLTPTAAKYQLAALQQMGEARAVAAIRHTIAKGWQGIREDDDRSRNDELPRLGVNMTT